MSTQLPYTIQEPTRDVYTIINEEYNNVALNLLEESQRATVKQFQDKIVEEFGEKWRHDSRDVVTLIKFLKARDFNLSKSFKLWVDRMKWIEAFQPHRLTSKDVEQELKSGLLFWYCRDYFGRPIVYVRTCNHFPVKNDEETERFFKYYVYMCEIGIMNCPKPPYNQVVIVSDQSYLGRANLDIKGYKRLFCLADYYPEVIHSIHLVYQPFVFNLMYKVGKQFLDKKTLAKIQMKSKQTEKLKDEMLRITDKSCLLPDHFGPRDPTKRFPYIPAQCPKEFVFAELRGRPDGTTQPYGTGNVVEEDEEVEDTPADSQQTSNSDGVDDLDLD